ncbi:hypothetical protein Dxin01_00202 [Deinococcus xinjiangensis]|uniref:Cellulose biosynthesis protein BcsF n=1 Tax=Deinococcus xinjiangensis TaxID=457454 RepID=A0ABP9V768_9DEIO
MNDLLWFIGDALEKVGLALIFLAALWTFLRTPNRMSVTNSGKRLDKPAQHRTLPQKKE